jgi:hypothetical protein
MEAGETALNEFTLERIQLSCTLMEESAYQNK